MSSPVLVLVRHAVALHRHEWDGADRYRPLSPRGHEQAGALVGVLRPFGPARVLSSPATRCVETVGPLAASLGLAVVEVEDLYEGHGTDALALLSDGVVACSHGDLLPELLLAVARYRDLLDDVPYDPPFAKGAVWVIDGERARYVGPPA